MESARPTFAKGCGLRNDLTIGMIDFSELTLELRCAPQTAFNLHWRKIDERPATGASVSNDLLGGALS